MKKSKTELNQQAKTQKSMNRAPWQKPELHRLPALATEVTSADTAADSVFS